MNGQFEFFDVDRPRRWRARSTSWRRTWSGTRRRVRHHRRHERAPDGERLRVDLQRQAAVQARRERFYQFLWRPGAEPALAGETGRDRQEPQAVQQAVRRDRREHPDAAGLAPRGPEAGGAGRVEQMAGEAAAVEGKPKVAAIMREQYPSWSPDQGKDVVEEEVEVEGCHLREEEPYVTRGVRRDGCGSRRENARAGGVEILYQRRAASRKVFSRKPSRRFTRTRLNLSSASHLFLVGTITPVLVRLGIPAPPRAAPASPPSRRSAPPDPPLSRPRPSPRRLPPIRRHRPIRRHPRGSRARRPPPVLLDAPNSDALARQRRRSVRGAE